MPHVNKAQIQIFIKTLSEMVAEERERKSRRAMLHARAQAERFLSRSFGDEGNGLRQLGKSTKVTLTSSVHQARF